MSLNNSDFDKIMHILGDRRRMAEDEFFAEKDRLEAEDPDLAAVSAAIRTNAIHRAKAKVFNDVSALQTLDAEHSALIAKQSLLLTKMGVTEEQREPRYTCPLCGDKGLVNGQKCTCFLELERQLLREKSHLPQSALSHTFENLSTDFYDRVGKDGKKSEYEIMTEKIAICRSFAESFDTSRKSLLLYGPTGVGKSFLSDCIANFLLASGHSVVYYSSVTLFEELSTLLSKRVGEDNSLFNEELLESDLLVIDDLGTEFVNSYTIGKFFQIINERGNRGKSTIISSNLDFKTLKERYSERIASRIIADFEPVYIQIGDLRVRQKLQNINANN